jgi:hypothetical protein
MPEFSDTLPCAGWREIVSLPEWGIRRIRAKLDTGALTSVVHASKIELIDDDRLRFEVVIRDGKNRSTRWIEADRVRHSKVKPSTGKVQRRHVVRTRMVLGELEREIELSLACRENMACRMLLGRRALGELVLVDSSQTYLLSSLNVAPASSEGA